MHPTNRKVPRTDREVALTAVAWLLLATPAAALWATPHLSWLAPFVLWLLLIAASATLSWLRGH